jgi:CTP synthase (UTP-ammonia lyase)
MTQTIRVGIVGDFDPEFRPHTATDEAIEHAAVAAGVAVELEWLPTPSLEQHALETVQRFDALWCAPGSPYQSLNGALEAIRLAREHGCPFIGTCGGFQHVVIEYARNVLGFADAQHAEYDPYASNLFISKLTCSLVGHQMRVEIKPDSKVRGHYGTGVAKEQYYCNFGLNPEHQSRIHEGGLRVVGVDQDGEARILELPGHNFYVATLFVPQLSSSAQRPHPIIVAYLEAAKAFNQRKQSHDPKTVQQQREAVDAIGPYA